MKTLFIQTRHLHLDSGEIVPGQVACAPGRPLEVFPGRSEGADMVLPDELHIALARVDTHVHFRESYTPTREEFEQDLYHPASLTYEEVVKNIEKHNHDYDVRRGSLAALKGGVWLAGAMGNTPWGPVGEARWRQMQGWYQKQAWICTHVWPRIEPGVPRIAGQDEKDFGSTYGGTGISHEQRRMMYQARNGGVISYHNDQARPDEDLLKFRERMNPPEILLHHLYYDGETVLAAQREVFSLAREVKLKGLHTRHIPTGPALDMVIRSRESESMECIAEVGLDYLYFNRDMLLGRATSAINYRRPALPSAQDQASLIALTRECAQRRDPLTFIGSDHAPHTWQSKQFKPNGLPGNPGTRILELSHQVHTHLRLQYDFNHADLDWLTARAPARYIAQYREFPFPVGTLETGAMANLVFFHPDESFGVDEAVLSEQLRDPEYHSAYRDEKLFGRVYYTVVNGMVFDVRADVVPVNVGTGEIDQVLQ